jgi:hypothetical protein
MSIVFFLIVLYGNMTIILSQSYKVAMIMAEIMLSWREWVSEWVSEWVINAKKATTFAAMFQWNSYDIIFVLLQSV